MRNALTNKQFYEICKIVEKHEFTTMALGDYKKAARLIMNNCTFRVTESNAKSAIEAVIFNFEESTGISVDDKLSELDFLSDRCFCRIKDLEKVILSLCKELGFDKESSSLKRIETETIGFAGRIK